jgi:hypothetical protein
MYNRSLQLPVTDRCLGVRLYLWITNFKIFDIKLNFWFHCSVISDAVEGLHW